MNGAYVKDVFGVMDEFQNVTLNGPFRVGQLKFDKATASYQIYKESGWENL